MSATDDYLVAIRIDPGAAIPTAQRVASELGKGEVAAERLGAAASRSFTAGAAAADRGRDAFGRFVAGARQGSSAVDGIARSAHAGRDALGRFTSTGTGSFAGLAVGANALSAEVNKLGLAIGALAAAGIAKNVLDGYTQISNRLNTVAKDQQNLNGLMEASHGIAQDTMQKWDVTAEAVVRFSNATKELGTSQRGVLDFTTSYLQSIALSGAAASEQAAAITQLGQALGKGKLDGDELKSISENAPIVIDVIAKGMQKSRGEIKKLGSEGQLTSQVIVEAFRKAAPDLAERFGKVVPTIEQSFTRLKNEAVLFFGAAGQGAGITRALGEAFGFVVAHFDTFAKMALGVGQALIGLFVISKVILLVKALGAAVAASPLGALLAALTVGVALLRQFGDQVETQHRVWNNVAGVYVTVGDYLRALWDQIKALGRAIVDFVESAWSKLTGAFSEGLDSAGIEFSLRHVLVFIASFVDAAISIFNALKKTILTTFGGIPIVIGEAFVRVAQNIVSVIQGMINSVIGAYNAVRTKLFDAVNETGQRRLAAVQEAAAGDKSQYHGDRITAAREAEARFPLEPLSSPRYSASQPGVEAARRKYIDDRMREFSRVRMTTAYERRGLDESGEDPRSGKIGKLDLSFDNPLDGALDELKRQYSDTWGKDFGSSVARDFVNGWADNLDKAARDKAVERLSSQKAPGTISGETGPRGKDALSKAQKSAREKLERELASLERASNPITEAQMKLAKAVDVTDRAFKAKLITMEEANQLVSETASRTADARDPLLAWRREIEAETAALGMSNGERERANMLLKATEELRQRGVEINAQTRADIEREIDAQRGAAAAAKIREERQADLQAALERIKGPEWEHNRGLELAKQLFADGAITAKEYAVELDRLGEAYRSAQPAGTTTEDGLLSGLRKIRQEATDVAGAMEDTLLNAYRNIETAAGDMVVALSQGWDEFAAGAKSAVKNLVETALRDLTRLALKQALLGLFGNGAAAAPATATAAPGIPFGDWLGGIAAALPGYARGGEGVIGGSGGPDSKLFIAKVTPGEHFRFTPPGQAPPPAAAPAAPAQVVRVVGVYDDSAIERYMESGRGETYHLAFRRREPAVRGRTTGR